jgi:membrane associated rhomboid family serine protease
MTGHGADDRSFVDVFRQRVGLTDVAALVAAPLVLVGVFLLPAELRRSLVFDYTDPSLPTAFASAFVHLDTTHLLVNLATYGLVVPVVFVLSVVSGRRQQFFTAFVTFLLVLPVLLSYLNLAILRSSVAFGFSGVVMAFAGYLPLALAAYADVHFDIGPRTSLAPVLFFLALGLIAALSVQSVVPDNATVFLGTSGLVIATLLSAVLYGVSVYQRGTGFVRKTRRAAARSGYFELAVTGLVLVFALPFVGFPTDPTLGDGAVNLYVHLLGYALGFLVPYVFTELRERAVD